MCQTCGCNDPDNSFTIHTNDGKHHHGNGDHSHVHAHGFVHNHGHSHDHAQEKRIVLDTNILNKNDLLAQRNKGFFEAKGALALNLMSSPGSGKTSLLEKTITALKSEFPIFVIEGDQQTTNDADRIKATGAPVIQINTGQGCHLDAEMVNQAVKELQIDENSVVMIENVGNLVCPALFDLGESKRVVIMSVTEGEDKPLKYPNMFQTADLCVINKIDLLPYLRFDLAKAKEFAKRVNPKLEFVELSVYSEQGMTGWYDWIRKQILEKCTFGFWG
jgi:hydrogenase nickel incorporation protein HypB